MTDTVDNSLFCRTDDDIGCLIWQLTKIWQRGKHRNMGEFGITGSQMEVLGAIKKLQDEVEITQIILSQETNIDPMTVSTILKNLQKKGLITRKESKVDTRARIVELTDMGNVLICKAFLKFQKMQEALFKRIDKDVLRDQLKLLLSELNKLEIQ
ncbi:MarR family winged helix-turn-helix transcriptional regulator [Viscerimonas tarda]